MSTKGKHASGETGGFYRDLIIMILGIILVGASVFLVLVLLADGPNEDTAPIGSDTSTTISEEPAASIVNETTTTTATTSAPTTSAPTTSAPTTVPVRPPDEVRVAVLNSMGLTGAAGRKTAELDDAGYQTLAADDYEPEQDPSRIWHREGFSAEANELLAYLDGAVVEPLPDDSVAQGADVILVLGTGYEE